MEAKIAAENAKKKTVAIAPKLHSSARAMRNNQDLLMTPHPPQRKVMFISAPKSPSLFTLERARQRA
jgi:hypothetical protein